MVVLVLSAGCLSLSSAKQAPDAFTPDLFGTSNLDSLVWVLVGDCLRTCSRLNLSSLIEARVCNTRDQTSLERVLSAGWAINDFLLFALIPHSYVSLLGLTSLVLMLVGFPLCAW
nr:hypothetical protein Iba_chr15aCG10930 [Ipomoea batatas]